jgi:hypothetical protein
VNFHYRDRDDDPVDDDPQPDDFCDCRPGTQLHKPWQHTPACPRWMPPLTGPGSTAEHRAAALAHIRAQIDAARRRRNEGTAR